MADTVINQESLRLREAREPGVPWNKWGPYLSERQWGTVREDYSDNGDAWSYFSHDQARSRAYRWGEDGLAGFSDDKQRLFRPGPVERQISHPQGAPLRAHQQRRQPRRGCPGLSFVLIPLRSQLVAQAFQPVPAQAKACGYP